MVEGLDVPGEVLVQPGEDKAKGRIFCLHLLYNHPLS